MNSLIKPRVVIDTNVLISGTLWGGKPGLIIREYQQGRFSLLISPFILAELASFLEKYQVKPEQRETILKEFNIKPIKIIPPKKVAICRDKKDNQVLNLCLAGRADFLVTGDKDLLTLKKFERTKIVKPRKFLEIIGQL